MCWDHCNLTADQKKESCFNILFLSVLKKLNVSNIAIHNQIQQYEMYKKHFNKQLTLKS